MAKGYQVTGVNSQQFNLLHPIDTLRENLVAADPHIIVHAAAYTQVDQAEREPELAMAVNKDGTRKLALLTKELGCLFALISTDYVFNGQQQRPYKSSDKPNPISTYGWSKYYAELMVSELLEEYYIIRTGWLYGIYGNNFVQFILDSVRQGRELGIVSDQVGGPTWAGSLCTQIETIISPSGLGGRYGIYHAVDSGSVSRYQQAQVICKVAGLSPGHIQPVSSQNFPQAAQRPAYSVLDPQELHVPHWETSLQAYFEHYRKTYLHAVHR